MKCFVAVTRLLNLKQKSGLSFYQFHFRGVYEGEIIKGLLVEKTRGLDLSLGEEYLLYLAFVKVKDGFLWSKVLKVKDLKSLRY